jgi:UrcA family protein
MRNIPVLALAAFSLAVAAIPAWAETRSVTVQYADLDLASPEGMATLQGRIDAAAKKICGRAEVRDPRDGLDQKRCMAETRGSVSVEIARVTRTRPALAYTPAR